MTGAVVYFIDIVLEWVPGAGLKTSIGGTTSVRGFGYARHFLTC